MPEYIIIVMLAVALIFQLISAILSHLEKWCQSNIALNITAAILWLTFILPRLLPILLEK